jgi:hypothetical protein
MSKRIVLTVLLSGALLVGCDNYDTRPRPTIPVAVEPPPAPPPPAPVKPMDVAGIWFSRTENNAVNCGNGVFVDAKALDVVQDENSITLLTSTGDTLSGLVNGDIIEWSGSYPEYGGTTTYTSASLVVSADTAAGNAAWTWTDGTDSCNGTMDISLGKDWGVPDDPRNSRPGIAQAFDFVDGVAYFVGAISPATDPGDYFSFELDADATIQIELSHFDLLMDDLDIELLDEDLNQIAFSGTADSFEMIEAQLQSGATYYIGVVPMAVAGDGSYLLSIDAN